MPDIATEADIINLSATDPATLGWPQTSYDLLRRAAEQHGARPALTFLPDPAHFERFTRWSFADLLAEVTRAANLFHGDGIGRGDVVAYCLPNLPETHFALWGAETAGVALAINPALAARQIAALLGSGQARLLVTTDAIWRTLAAEPGLAERLARVYLVDGRETVSTDARVRNFQAALAEQPGDRLLAPPPRGEDDSSFFCTGGTTGAPKIARRRHSGETGNSMMTAAVLGEHLSKDSVFLCGLPMFHVNAIAVTGLLPWSAGAEVILASPAGYRDLGLIDNFWRIIERFRVSFFSGVPTLYAMLLERPIGDADISSLDSAICGAAPMPTELFRRFEAATGVNILEGYGLTESGCVAALNPIGGERRIGSIGLRLPWQDLLIAEVDSDGHYIRDCAAGEVGAVLLKGLNVFLGYVDEDHNKGLWVERDGALWMNTGDLGRMDTEGYVWLTGRKKELIIRGGHNIDPALIEEALNAHPDIAMAAAVPRPDQHSGEVPVAYVQLRDGAEVSPEELSAHAARAVPERAAIPKAIRVVDALPQTAVGKLFKPDLVMREIADVIRTEAKLAGLDLSEITVKQVPGRGYVAYLSGAENEDRLHACLSGFAFGVEIA
ncbi:acyl-CoA synthetase [Pseudodonghicola xiamenensis]|uniref:Acyl-CoA synthetase n=1 Tax=Pseudodonghicola xiamenensis TaxID=337702 RepID=A0A8J3MG93_9RHOB|nr:acyl-CoA synthetase [Pseudodonghicola xiamenensis]GHG99586.1 acyl-CoA synthetase [Pseudodonghicola xiamenensis]